MVNDDRAKWVSTNPNGYKGWYGYNAHTLLNSMVTMAEGVRLFLASKESTNQLQSFINNYASEPYIHTVDEAPNPIDLDNIQSEYEQGAIIKDALYFVACDVQQLYIPAVVLCQLKDDKTTFSRLASAVALMMSLNYKNICRASYNRCWL